MNKVGGNCSFYTTTGFDFDKKDPYTQKTERQKKNDKNARNKEIRHFIKEKFTYPNILSIQKNCNHDDLIKESR